MGMRLVIAAMAAICAHTQTCKNSSNWKAPPKVVAVYLGLGIRLPPKDKINVQPEGSPFRAEKYLVHCS